MRSILSTQSLPEAELFRELLKENGIESMLDNQNAPIPGAAPLVVSVAEPDESLALHLLQEHQGRK